MANSAAKYSEHWAREIVPSELLPLHEGLEEDGESWRAALPRTDNLIRRVTARRGRPRRSGGPRFRVNSVPLLASATPASPGHARLSLLRTRAQRKDGRH